jgi:hypothetical protein
LWGSGFDREPQDATIKLRHYPFFAWKATPHPSWLVKIGMWIAGFLAIYVAIPVIEVVVVLIISLISN